MPDANQPTVPLGKALGELFGLLATYSQQLKLLPACADATIPFELPEQLILLQSNWAYALNAADGGKRYLFGNFGEWTKRMEEEEVARKDAKPQREGES